MAAHELRAQVPALHDPQRSVFAAFPAADGYRRIPGSVNDKARKRIEARLPFRVHFDELGDHSLYVAFRGNRPIGMIYAQDEESAFGLAAVEWAFTFDLQVSSFRFERARSKYRRSLEGSEFVRLLKGTTTTELEKLVGPEGRLLAPAKGVDPEAQELASAVVRSGIKSLVVLGEVWGGEIAKLRDLTIGLESFPQALEFRRIWPPATPPEVTEAEAAPLDGDVLLVVRAFAAQSRALGIVAECRLGKGIESTIVRWAVNSNGVVISADVPPGAPRNFRAACNDIEGKKLEAVAARADSIGSAMRRLHELTSPKAEPPR